MHSLKFVVILHIITHSASRIFAGASKFRILAPQFICPKDEDAIMEKSDNTVITLQTAADTNLDIKWTVRWKPLVSPTQRFTLMLWRTVRTLEKQLNRPQPEPFVYVIENSDLLRGVNYIFNVSAVEEEASSGQTFNIDNTQGDQKLMIDGRHDMLSIILLGAQTVLADAAFAIEAQVTTCYATQDYYFSWAVVGLDSKFTLNVSKIEGSRIEIPPYTLNAGFVFNMNCKVIRHTTGELITQTGLPFKVSKQGLSTYLNVDFLIIPVNSSFSIDSIVINHDYYGEHLTYTWQIRFQGEDCNFFQSKQNTTLFLPFGLPLLGEYQIILTVDVFDQTSRANATIITVANNLPVIQIAPVHRLLNEGSELRLVANASNVTPTCRLTWYFETDAQISENNNSSCDNCQHGEPLSDIMTVFSLEEQFLNELTDYTNDTEWREVTVTLSAKPGRARFVAECGCSLTFSCDAMGTVYADVWFQVNESPKAGEVMVSPNTGIALETIFRISTMAATDPDTPLQYNFYCKVGDDDALLLASYYEHRAVETFLPYMGDDTDVWVEICDALGACSQGNVKKINLSSGNGNTVDVLIEDVIAHIRRCELLQLQRVAASALVTYTHSKQPDIFSKFSKALMDSMSTINKSCVEERFKDYSDTLLRFERFGIKTKRM